MFQRIIWHRSHPWRPMASSTHIFMQKWSFLRYFSKRAEFCDSVQSRIPKLCLHAKNQPSSPKIDHFTGMQIFGPTTDFSLGVPATVQAHTQKTVSVRLSEHLQFVYPIKKKVP